MKASTGAAHIATQAGHGQRAQTASGSASVGAGVESVTPSPAYSGLRGVLQRLVDSAWFQTFIMAVIVANAVTLGLETVDGVMSFGGGLLGAGLKVLDRLFLAVFVVEILVRLYVQRVRYFRDGWNWFDLIVVGVALVPTSEGLSALRTIRVVRALRLLSMMPSMRRVVGGLIQALPGMFSAMILLALIHYVYAVIGVNLFGGTLYAGYGEGYDYFADLGRATYTLFQVMTLESWSHGIARPILDVHPGPVTTLYFVSYVILSAFAALNLFIGIIVNAMDTLRHDEAMSQTAEEAADPAQQAILVELRALREEVAALSDGGNR